jgi:hypothetical protein
VSEYFKVFVKIEIIDINMEAKKIIIIIIILTTIINGKKNPKKINIMKK